MWDEPARGELVLAPKDNATAVAYANDGVGRSPDLTRLARAVQEWGIALKCTAVALYVAGKSNAEAGAYSRVSLRATGGDPYPDRDLRNRFRAQVEARCGRMDVDMLARGDGKNARARRSVLRPGPLFECPLPSGRQWWSPCADMIGLAPARILLCVDGRGRPSASRRVNRGRSGFPDLARSSWHCVSPAPLFSLWAVRVASQFPPQMGRMSIGL